MHSLEFGEHDSSCSALTSTCWQAAGQGPIPKITVWKVPKWVYDDNPVQFPRILQILREQDAAAGLFGGPQDKGIPKRKFMESVEIDCGQDVPEIRSSYIKLGEEFYFAPRNSSINV